MSGPQMIFVNLPVSDLAASRAFMEAIGTTNEPKFTDDTAACMVAGDNIFFMLLTHDKYRQFSPLPAADAKAVGGPLLCLSRPSRAAVDADIAAGVAAGGTADPTPPQDYGMMYGRSLLDPDGHHFELMWMDPAMAEQGAHPVEPADA
ncbi:lactoylglutathione lyase [Sphingomonas sp. ASV193]|uniref:VOC family protein n=1 Tax=Sphingomonas sp. ASV193 TaxID=3144405 RepID=UPI0032E911D2